MKTIEIGIKGISPLLQNRWPLEDQGVEAKSKNRKKEEDNAEKRLYRMDDGTIFEPCTHIIASMKKAGAKFQILGQGKTTYKNIIGAGAIIITPESIPHKYQQYSVDSRRVVIKGQGAVTRKRPCFNPWALDFTIEYDEEEISAATIKTILDYAGRYVGIGDFRPEKGGPFGRFTVTNFKEQ